MLRIYADFNSPDEQGRVVLDTVGSHRDIETHRETLAEGMDIVLYMTDELEVHGTLIFDKVWRAIPHLSTIHYDEPEPEGLGE